jgi:signal transduction histidine kinase
LKSQTAVYVNPRTGRFGKVVLGDSTNESSVHYIFEDSSRALWFSTVGAGLIRLSPDRRSFRKYTMKSGLPSDVLYGILEDDHKQLWIGSTKGLICLNPQTHKIKVYTQENGLISNQFNFNSAYKSAEGKLYFGSMKGLIAFDPAKLNAPEHAPKTFFTGFQINNSEVGPGELESPLKHSISYTDTIILSPDQRNFSIEFAALNFSSAKATRYQYRMTGLDRAWTYSNASRKAYFTDLAPGRYTFTVKASSNVGKWISTERSLYIEVLPPLWRSSLAYVFYTIVFCLLFFLGLRLYHSSQKKRNLAELKLFEHEKEKEIYQAKIEFFTHIAHEIQTPLTLISVPVTRILNKADDYPSIKKSLLTIGKYTNRLVILTSQLLDFRQTELEQFGLSFVNIDIGTFLEELTESFQDLASDHRIALSISLPSEDIIAFVDREALSKICSNLITNAIKYAQAIVSVSLSGTDLEHFSIIFKNDGNGIPEEFGDKIFEPFFRLKTTEKPGTGIGLSLARSLAELHRGSLHLTSGETDKIIFELTLPFHQEHEFNLGSWKKL